VSPHSPTEYLIEAADTITGSIIIPHARLNDGVAILILNLFIVEFSKPIPSVVK
jgi:hypothetical protein